jgi:cytochrome P450
VTQVISPYRLLSKPSLESNTKSERAWLCSLFPHTFRLSPPVLVYFPPLRREFGGLGLWSRFKRLAARFERLILEEIGSRRRRPDQRDDILSLLLDARYEDGSAMSDQELCDELKTLLLAGHETTTIALVWAFYWIHSQPEVRRRLGEELKDLGCAPPPEDLARLPHLRRGVRRSAASLPGSGGHIA